MRNHYGMTVQPKVPCSFGQIDFVDKKKIERNQNTRPDLQIGDTYNGLPIVGVTAELYICKHAGGFKECFQKKDRRLGINASLYDSEFDNVMLAE